MPEIPKRTQAVTRSLLFMTLPVVVRLTARVTGC